MFASLIIASLIIASLMFASLIIASLRLLKPITSSLRSGLCSGFRFSF